jgi:hypothetical protein
MLMRGGDDGAFAATLPEAATFSVVTVPTSSRVILEWRVTSHARLASVELRVRSRNVERMFAFGEQANYVDPERQSYCARAGWVDPSGYEEIRNRSFGAWFAIGEPQSYVELVAVRDHDALHVLRHQRTRGGCDSTYQGMLAICAGGEFERVAEVRGTRDAGVFELVTIDGKDIRCGGPRRGERLVKP